MSAVSFCWHLCIYYNLPLFFMEWNLLERVYDLAGMLNITWVVPSSLFLGKHKRIASEWFLVSYLMSVVSVSDTMMYFTVAEYVALRWMLACYRVCTWSTENSVPVSLVIVIAMAYFLVLWETKMAVPLSQWYALLMLKLMVSMAVSQRQCDADRPFLRSCLDIATGAVTYKTNLPSPGDKGYKLNRVPVNDYKV